MLVRCIPLLRKALSGACLTGVLLTAVTLPAALPAPAAAQSRSDIFTVERVPVDVTATNAALARDQAIVQAQRDAFDRLFDRLTLDEDGVAPPPLGPAEVERLVASFEVVSERTSAVRYVAEVNVSFRPAAVRALMLSSGIRYTETRSKPVLVLPVDETGTDPVLWQRETPWRLAWENFAGPPSLLPILVPYGELQDVTDIDVTEALAGNEEALRRIADRYEAGAVAVARLGLDGDIQPPAPPRDPLAPADPKDFLATPGTAGVAPVEPVAEPVPALDDPDATGRPRGLTAIVTIHRFDGQPEVLTIDLPPPSALPEPEPLPGAETVPPAGGEPVPGAVADAAAEGIPPATLEMIPLAVDRVANAMEQNWIRANLLETGSESVLNVRVPLSSLQEWMETRSRLAQVPTITRTRLTELSRDGADIELFYLGDPSRLRTALSQRDLLLNEPVPPLARDLMPQGMPQGIPLGGGMPAAQDQPWTLQWRGAAGARPQPAMFGDPVPADLTGGPGTAAAPAPDAVSPGRQ